MATAPLFLGNGILRPFLRDEKNDFANADGVRLVKACVGQVLGTQPGEIPWRQAFGSKLHLLRHRPNNPALAALAKVYILDALRKWEKRVQIGKVAVTRSSDQRTLTFDVSFSVVDRYGTVVSTGSITSDVSV